MRRSSVVQLTLLPMLASAAVAAADPDPGPPPDATTDPTPDATTLSPPGMPDPGLSPPGMMEPELGPPGMTPSIMELDCDEDPNWRLRPDCDEVILDGFTVIRGGFGNYFWTGGG